MSYEKRLLDEDYFYIHSEPHRRRPTVVRFPQLVTHTATYYSTNEKQFPRRAFRNWLLNTFKPEHLGKASPWVLRTTSNPTPDAKFDEDFIGRFSQVAQQSVAEEDENASKPGKDNHDASHFDVEFFIELQHAEHPQIVLRLEAHREYFCITLFRALAPDELSLRTCFDLCAELTPKPKHAELDANNPFHMVYKSIAVTFKNATFANFQGIVLGKSCLEAAPETPFFPKYGAAIPDETGLAQTVRFLKQCRTDFGAGVLAANRHDAIACYFQHYQALYISGLGSQATKDSKDPLRYIIIHNEPSFDQTEPSFEQPDYDAEMDRHRVSRLVNRLNSIGTLRLAALRDLRLMRRAGERLRRIEMLLGSAGVEPKQKTRRDELTAIMHELDQLVRESSNAGVPVFYRTARAKYYFAQMQRLLVDMDVGHIPSWQNYKQFLHRRLYSSFEFAAGLGQRILDLWEIARSRAEVAEAHALSWMKSAANAASVILLPLAVADMARDRTPFAEFWSWLSALALTCPPIASISAFITGYIPAWLSSWWQKPGVQEFVITYILALFIWLMVIAPLGNNRRVSRPATRG